MNFTRFSFLAVVLLALAAPGRAATYYVRVTGNDSWGGTTAGTAWKTIAKAADVASAGDTVYVGGGTYPQTDAAFFWQTSTAATPIKLVADTTGAKTGDAGNVYIQCPTGFFVWYFLAPAHYQITGFKFKKDPAATGDTYAVVVYPNLFSSGSNSYTFTSCTFDNLYVDFAAVGSSSVTMTSCTSTGNTYVGSYFQDTTAILKSCTFKDQQNYPVYCVGSTAFDISDSTFTNNTNYGLYTSEITSLKCTNTVFSNARYSLLGSANTIDVSSCTFSLTDAFSRANWTNYAAWLKSPTNGAVSLANSTISAYNVGIQLMSNDAVVTNVNITGMGTDYYKADWTPNPNWRESYGIIARGSPGSGGAWNDCKRFKYTGTSGTISNCYMGIFADSADVTVENATIPGQIYGVYATGGSSPGNKLTLTSSTIKDCLWSGVTMDQGASLTATSSKFLNNGVNKSDGGWSWGWGVSFHGYKAASANYWDGVPGDATLTVQNCEFTGNGSGFRAASFKKANVTLSGNTVDGGLVLSGTTPVSHFGWGAWLGNGDYALQSNEFSVKKCYYGLGTQYGAFSVKNYTIRDNYHGVYVQNNNSATVTNCTLTANSGAGLYSAGGATVTVMSCDLSGNGYGLRDDHGKAISITDSTANNNVNDGIHSEYADAIAVERCKTLSNGNWGLYSYLIKSATIRNNVVAKNKCGVWVGDSGTGTQVWNNTIASNTTNYGLYADSGNVTARNNIITSNGAYGLGSNTATLVHSNNLVYGHSSGTDFWKTGLTPAQAAALRTADEPNKPPRFMDLTANDFRLAKGSPAINAGMNSATMAANDMLGNTRPMYGVTEIGAYEYIDKSGSIRPLTWYERK
jgi:parallel beta-helix repeat protein